VSVKVLLRRILPVGVVSALLTYLGLTGLLWWAQDALVFLPSTEYVDLPQHRGLVHEEVDIDVASDTKIRGWFVRAFGVPHGTILYFHGNAGNLSTNLSHIRRFAEEGFDSFSIDYEGYGASDGVASESNFYRDADAAWEWLTETKGVEPENIMIWGHSLGGGAATWCASRHTPRMVVLESTFTSMPDMGAHIYWWLPVRLISHNFFANLERVPAIQASILIAHGKGDELIPFEMGEDLFQGANEPKRFVELDGGHNNGFVSTPRAWKEMKALFAEAAKMGN
jgi:alpha-beta hydrolase superfamily lysophospholipase